MIVGVWQAGMVLRERQEMDVPTVLVAMRQMSEVWENLFPIEQNRIMRLSISGSNCMRLGWKSSGAMTVGSGSAGNWSGTSSWPNNERQLTRRWSDGTHPTSQPGKRQRRAVSRSRRPANHVNLRWASGRSVTFVPLAIKRRHSS